MMFSMVVTVITLRINQGHRQSLTSNVAGSQTRDRSITMMTITITLLYILFTSPYGFGNLVYQLAIDPMGELPSVPLRVKVNILEATTLVWNLGPAFNSLIVIVVTKWLRDDFKRMFINGKKARPAPTAAPTVEP